MSTSRRLRGPLYALLFSLAFLACAPPRAAAQATGTAGTVVVPHPPIQGNHYAEQDKDDPETAYDKWNKHTLKWDRVRKSWIDQNSGVAVGFEGQLASDGTVIPAPPFISSPQIGMYWPRQDKPSDDNGRGNPERAYYQPKQQMYHWDPIKQSWFAAAWDPNTRTLVNVGSPLGFYGALTNANSPKPPATAVPAAETAPLCPTPEECVRLQEIYQEADARSVAAGQALIQATADRDSDLARAGQLDKSAAHRGDPDVSKAEQQQAQGLRDKLSNAQANYDAASRAALDAWKNWQDCLKGIKDCPPKGPAQAGNGAGTTSNPRDTTGGNTSGATPGAPSEPLGPSNAALAADLCDRAKVLRDIAAHERQMADTATDDRTKTYHLDQARMSESMAKEREDLARHYDPNACPEHLAANPGGGGEGQNGAVAQNSGEAMPDWGPWILVFPGLPLWNREEQRWYGRNPDGTPRTEVPPSSGADEWILIYPGLPLWNPKQQRWYGYNPDHSPTNEPPINSSPIPSNSSGSPVPSGETPAGPVGETQTTPALQCTASTPTLRHEGMDELTVDIALMCAGTPPANSSIGLRSSIPATGLDARYSFGGQNITNSVTPERNGHAMRVNLPDDLGKTSNFKMDFDLKYDLKVGYDHLNIGFRDSPGISINPQGFTAPITDDQIQAFQSSPLLRNPWDPTGALGGFRGWGMNRTPSVCTDTTTTSYVALFNSSALSSPSYSPPPCNFDDLRGTLTFGPMNLGGWRGYRPLDTNTPGGAYTAGSGSQLTPDQNGSYLNGTWGQTPQTPGTTPGFTGNGYGGFYNPSPFSYIRPQAYYDDSGPQSRFLIADPWNMRPSYCDYDFPDKLLRAAPELAQALAAESRSRQPRANRAPREALGAHLQLVSLKRGSPTSNPSNRAGRAQPSDQRTRQVQIETRFLEVAPTFTYSIVSNGKSQGQAFELQVANPTGKVKTVAMRDGTIIEAIKPGVTEPVTAPDGGSVVKQQLNAYCLEFHKPPPAEGTLYRIADQATQEKFSSLRFLDRAAAQMSQNNQFHPDNNPEAYKNTIFQYAAWSTLEGWGQEEFTQHWVERTKENAQDLHVPWTKQMEETLRNAAPGRWGDISAMMSQAQALEKTSQDRANSRQTREQQ